MEKIIQILMKRDGLTRQEAINHLEDVRQMMNDCCYEPEECEEIFIEQVGLEPDYLMDFLLG